MMIVCHLIKNREYRSWHACKQFDINALRFHPKQWEKRLNKLE